LPNGVPSYDTFSRFYAALDPKVFHQSFLKWIKTIQVKAQGDIAVIDGKHCAGLMMKSQENPT
jgi:hypothetical protein